MVQKSLQGDKIRGGEECRADRNDWSADDVANTSISPCHRENLIIRRRPRSVMHRFHPQKLVQRFAGKDDGICYLLSYMLQKFVRTALIHFSTVDHQKLEHPYPPGDHLEVRDSNRIGSGAYSDVYKARRLSDDLTVALKEVHDYQSAFREIEALQTLRHSPNVVELHEYFWSEDEDAVLVLEYLPTDLASVIRTAKKELKGLSVERSRDGLSRFY
ncbi:hypothetical protein L2E82_13101 [Cichorium intybus]|uniref:Uncharacterized protein n=1 Tax=Cichorium intybus TaxID=13427 RepID=A0ACB9GHD3_CICIN|nr:hypothetical protein L2E82_13101 [Cichorium intybus]